jgi:hypothetical protein
MKSRKISTKILGFFAALALFISAFIPALVMANVGGWSKGASIVPRNSTDFSSSQFRQSLDDLLSTGSNYVTLIIPYYQSNLWSHDLHPGWNTPTDQSLIDGINYAHSIGLNVKLKPHMETYGSDWRANINPTNRNAWFAAYGNMLNHYGRIAESHGVSDFVIGTELINMATSTSNPGNTSEWINLINNVRSVYGGKLTYSANWGGGFWNDEKNHIDFWPQLDYMGISAYWPLNTPTNDVDALRNEWSRIDQSELSPLMQRIGMPMVFTEVGYRSMDNARHIPWSWWDNNATNLTEQANLYEALISYWSGIANFNGMSLWGWSPDPNAGGLNDNQYTPQNKPAEEVMRQWFMQGTSGPTDPPPSLGMPNFSTSATASPSTVPVNTPTSITATIVNAGQNASSAIVDVEIYQNNTQVHQSFFENQNFTADSTRNYTFNWTPSQTGSYQVKIGVFSSGWTSLHTWNDSAATISVISEQPGTPTPPPPPPPTTDPEPPAPPPQTPPIAGQIDIWWPTDGSHVSGLQPFKAMVPNADINSYRMYWRVDGGQLNQMHTDHTDWPHKLAWVDLSPWKWQPAGNYTLEFVVHDLNGNQMATRSITIHVAN